MNSSTSISDACAARHFIRRFIGGWLCLLALPALLVTIMDPYQIFHPYYFGHAHLFRNERFQNAGLINSYINKADGYNTVIIGTSQSSNFDTAEIQRLSGWKALNLAMRGSSLQERMIVLSQAIKSQHIHNVIFEINVLDAYENPATDHINTQQFPLYLYGNFAEQWHYVFNQKTLWHSLLLMFEGSAVEDTYFSYAGKRFFNQPEWSDDLAGYQGWATNDDLSAFNAYNDVANLTKMKNDLQATSLARNQFPWQQQTLPSPVVQDTLIPFIINHPDITFYLWIAPNNLYWYAVKLPTYVDQQFSLHKTLVTGLAAANNARIFSFDDQREINGDLNNYMDQLHFKPDIQQLILTAMFNNQHRMTTENVDHINETLLNNIKSFDIAIPASR